MYGAGYPSSSFGTAPAPARPAALRVKLTNREKGVYSNLFTKADPESTNRVEGRAAVEFFKKSGLPIDILKEVWNISAPNGESFLDRERFYVSMRLIALAQQGRPVTAESILNNVEVEPPQFSLGGPERPEADQFEISPEDRQKYEMIFNNNSGGKGALTGYEARVLFERTGVEVNDLSRIWSLADPQDTGQLTKSQFLVAMHLIIKVKQKIRVPDVLPPSLSSLLVTPLNPVIQASQKQELFQEFGAKFGGPEPMPFNAAVPGKKPGIDSQSGFPDPQGMGALPMQAFPNQSAMEKRGFDDHFGQPMARGFDERPSQPVVAGNKPQKPMLGGPPPQSESDFMDMGPAPFAAPKLPEPRREQSQAAAFKPEAKRDPPAAAFEADSPVVGSAGPRGYERKEVDDSSLKDLLKTVKALDTQIQALTEEVKNGKKEVRMAKEETGRQLEDFSKQLKRHEDNTEEQIVALFKEVKKERQSNSEVAEQAKAAAKQMSESIAPMTTLRSQCEETLKQHQQLSMQLQAFFQQIAALQAKNSSAPPPRQPEQVRPQPEPQSKVEPRPAPEAKRPEPRPDIQGSEQAGGFGFPQNPGNPVRTELREPPKKLPDPPRVEVKEQQPVKKVAEPQRKIEERPVLKPMGLPEPAGFEDDFDFDDQKPSANPKIETLAPSGDLRPKPAQKPQGFDFGGPISQEKSDFDPQKDQKKDFDFGPPRQNRRNEEFDFGGPVVTAPKGRNEGLPPQKPSGSSFDFNVAEPPKVTKETGASRKDFSFDDRQLPPQGGKGGEAAKDGFSFEFNTAPVDQKGFDFGDFKAFEGNVNPDLQKGVFGFDAKSVQQQGKKIAFEF